MDRELAKLIYHRAMSTMKFTLDLEERQYEKGRNDPRFKFFKKMLMSNTYENMRGLFKSLEDWGLVAKTDYPEDVKNGYKDTSSGGAGYLNVEEFTEWLNSDGSEDCQS